MAFNTSVKIGGIEEIKKGLSSLEKDQFPFAMQNAINGLSQAVLNEERALLKREIDRPTPYSQNALKIKYATKTKLEGGVLFKDPPSLSPNQHYLYPNVEAQPRGFKKFEALLLANNIIPKGYKAIPGKDTLLDAYGNVPRSTITEIINWFKLNPAKTNSTNTVKKKKGTKKKYGYDYIYIKERIRKLSPGIYKVTTTPFGTSIRSVFIFVPSGLVKYKKKYHFYEKAISTFNLDFKKQFDFNMQQALLTAFR
jgi:hypothetical protein